MHSCVSISLLDACVVIATREKRECAFSVHLWDCFITLSGNPFRLQGFVYYNVSIVVICFMNNLN